jgi:RNA polymerase sigma-70 factor (ECF subfamily)
MSALQHSVCSQPSTDRPFAVKNNKRRKTVPTRSVSILCDEADGSASASEDQGLIRRAITGDSEAQARLFATHTPKLYRVALNVLRNKEDAEDAIQNTWCRAYSRLHTFEGRSSLSTWLTRIAINSALMILRRNKHRFEVLLEGAAGDQEDLRHYMVNDGPTPEEACSNAEMNDLLLRQIDRLPPIIRTAFVLRDVNEFTTSESIKLLGINTSALKSRVQRARRRLAQDMLRALRKDRRRNRSLGGIAVA